MFSTQAQASCSVEASQYPGKLLLLVLRRGGGHTVEAMWTQVRGLVWSAPALCVTSGRVSSCPGIDFRGSSFIAVLQVDCVNVG